MVKEQKGKKCKKAEEVNKEELRKKRLVAKEKRRLKKIFDVLNENQKEANEELINNLAFTSILLKELQEIILTEGVVEKYKNGENQYGYKESVASKAYNNNIKNLISMVRTLNSILPENKKIDPENEFDFMAGDYK